MKATKFLSLLLALVMVLGLAACGGEASAPESAPAESVASAPMEEPAEEAPEAPAEEPGIIGGLKASRPTTGFQNLSLDQPDEGCPVLCPEIG